ncbi:MAG: tetratricopeptide repeat protein [candidate division KSB1 bacterium]|nr:tetratricopeptide repeat protein [candidate division KSB1 bacterium]MDZ7318977.1 tetratricopeptide repeat protein [candidate division KSB1 bacterium]MDZ7340985.1 tetratricopeptide repeat protein [candidate division KSB1 bacterium]
MKWFGYIAIWSIGVGFIFSIPVQAQDDSTLFREAKTLMFQQKYDDAISRYELLKLKYPDSQYSDDSEFWSAYILEHQGKHAMAFAAFEGLIQKYPGSPWVDDALIHQIDLAEKFIRQGQNSYLSFLASNLQSPYTNVRYQAALSLGKLGDTRARPILNEMANNGDRDMRVVAKSLLQGFQQGTPAESPRIMPFPDKGQSSAAQRPAVGDQFRKVPESSVKQVTPPPKKPQLETRSRPPGSQQARPTPPSKQKNKN